MAGSSVVLVTGDRAKTPGTCLVCGGPLIDINARFHTDCWEKVKRESLERLKHKESRAGKRRSFMAPPGFKK